VKVIFIIGTFESDRGLEAMKDHEREAAKLAEQVMWSGAVPLLLYRGLHLHNSRAQNQCWLDRIAELLRRSDAAVCTPGEPERSASSEAIRGLCRKLGVPILDRCYLNEAIQEL
jgi:hypothetical protein